MADKPLPENKNSLHSARRTRRCGRRTIGKDTPAARWRRMVGLAGEAIAALEDGRLDAVRDLLAAMEAVARRAAEEELADSQ